MNTWLLSMQDSNSPICDLMIFFHDFTMMILIMITTMIFFIMMSLLKNFHLNRFLMQMHSIEIIWTILPMLILLFIAFPSINLLYLSDEINSSSLTIKTIGHQWYWSYEYNNLNNINFDSYMINLNELNMNEFRLLDVDNRCIIPFNYPIRIITTSMDVIHAWSIPSLGIKMDSTPGRLNQSLMYLYRPGLFYGQCSEICGINHSFMPIVIESTNFQNFTKWINMM